MIVTDRTEIQFLVAWNKQAADYCSQSGKISMLHWRDRFQDSADTIQAQALEIMQLRRDFNDMLKFFSETLELANP